MRNTCTLLALLSAAPLAAAAGAPAPLHAPLHAPTACDGLISVGAGGAFIDACGRTRVFHGVNTVQKSPPYIPSSDFSRDGNSLSAADAALYASLGLNVLRLGIMWAGAAPHARGAYNSTYLSALNAMSQSIYETQGIYTFLDSHQDGFSEAFCDDGAPAWAAIEYSRGAPAFPEPLARPINTSTDCGALGSIPWAELYFTYAVGQAFQNLYNTSVGKKDYGDFWSQAVTAFAGNAGVLGWELLNEPWAGNVLADPLRILPSIADAELLQPFYESVTAALRAAEAAAGAPPRIVFSEPVTYDVFFPAGFSELPGGKGARGLSYHYYSLPDVFGYQSQVETRAADATRLDGGGILSEFECVAAAARIASPAAPPFAPVLSLSQTPLALHPFTAPRSIDLQSPVVAGYSVRDLRGTLDAVDAARHSWIGWASASIWFANQTLCVADVRELARPYPRAVAGANASWQFAVAASGDLRAGSLSLSYTLDAAARGGTEVFVSTGLWWAAGDLRVSAAPAGLVEWAWEFVDGAVALPGAGAPASLAPPAGGFAHAFLRVTPLPGAAASGARVTVVVTAAPAAA